MEIIHKVKMDLARQGISPRIPAVQGDAYTRRLDIFLFAEKRPWKVPTDAAVMIRYRKPDRTSGTYDTLADGTSAVSVSGNRISILVAPEALSAAGTVCLMVTILQGDQRLSTFSIDLAVQADCVSGWDESEGAAWIAAFLPSPERAEAGNYLAVGTVDEKGHVLSVQTIEAPGMSQQELEAAIAEYMERHNISTGTDGISATHTWNGTVLTITSASGTSSADLKGEKGDAGADGNDGLTPFIGENGNWWIGEADTGVSASGQAEAAILETQTVTGFASAEVTSPVILHVTLDLIVGNSYSVVWDGTEYICQCGTGASANGTTITSPYLGNPGIFLKETGATDYPNTAEPFLIIANGTQSCILSCEEGDSHTVAIYRHDTQPISITHQWNGTVLTVTSASGTSSAELKGDAGANGLTPFIGHNGNWWIGETDTGTAAAADTSASLPPVTAEDNGKFLQVVDGTWTAATVDSAEEASF